MPKLFRYLDKDDLRAGLEGGLISQRVSPDGLVILNYTDRAMYTPGAWDSDAVRKCRGLIFNPATNDIIARPWVKFFNHNQPEAGTVDLDEPVEVTDKWDGSLGILYLDNSSTPRVATRGSFESDQAIWASEWLALHPDVLPNPEILEDYTFLVEIVYPENRIVVNYGEYAGLVLLGAVHIKTGDYFGPNEIDLYYWGGDRTEVFQYHTLREALAAPPRPGQEGLCVRYLNENRIVKIKQEDYVQLHRLVFGLSRKSVWEFAFNNDNPQFEQLVDGLPDEFLVWCEEVWNELQDEVTRLKQEASRRLQLVMDSLPPDPERRDVAQGIMSKEHRIYSSLMFQLLDNKDLTKAALKYIKDNYSGLDRVRVQDESVA